MANNPPKFFQKLFKAFCENELFEELQGDLEEAFHHNAQTYGPRKARARYRIEVLKMIRPSVFKKRSRYQSSNYMSLLSSYGTIAIRSIFRHKLFSFINVFSLSVAMSTGLLVIGMISDLLKFDEFHERKSEIYRVISSTSTQPDKYYATSPFILGTELKSQFPDLSVTQLGRKLNGDVSANDKKLDVSGIYADEHFFDFLSFNLIRGNTETALKEPFSAVLSRSFALKLFEKEDVLGEVISIKGLGDLKVTGVVEDPPIPSHIQFEIIGSISTRAALANQGRISRDHDGWRSFYQYYNYLHLPQNIDKNRIKDWLENTAPSFYKNQEEFTASFGLQRLNQIVPGPNLSNQIGPKMIMLPIIVFSIIAIAILLSAIFNYTNLSMARAIRRAREVGVRKLNGATNKMIFFQFMVEAILLSIFSLGLGVLIFLFLRKEFIQIIPRASEVLQLELSTDLILLFLGFAIICGLIAGLAPSAYFASLRSLSALRSKGNLKTLSKVNFRKGMIVAQFSLSIIFILAVVITRKQYMFSLNHDLGFNKENVLNISLNGNEPNVLQSELMALPEVLNVSFSSLLPGTGTGTSLQLIDKRNQDSVWINSITVDHNYINNMGIELLLGRNFRFDENKNQLQSMIVNETFVKNFGLESAEEALGVTFIIQGKNVEIVGIVKDFHYLNLEEPIRSFALLNNPNYQYANLKLKSNDQINTIAKIESIWNKLDAKNRLNAAFYDDQLEIHYKFLADIMKIFGFIGFLAISISCLGLFGITIYSTEIRMKEIGIRKTFGASVKSLLILLSKGFLKLVFWAVLIGTPICYILFDNVILAQSFYRTEITFIEIGISIFVLLILCLVTIGTQTWSAAISNPSKILRNE